MESLIGLLGFLGFIACTIMMIISFFRKNSKIKKFGIGALITFFTFVGCASASPTSTEVPINKNVNSIEKSSSVDTFNEKKDGQTVDNKDVDITKETNPSTSINKPTKTDKMQLHFIDVGQADSILILDNGKSMLIDAGNNDDSDLVVNYIKNQGIKKLDIVIGTHAHEDHIGGMDKVIDSFDIGAVYMPKQQSNTKTFEDVLIAIKNKGLKITTPTPGAVFKLNSVEGVILAPNGSSYEDINNSSIVVRLTYGSNSFMLTGDAEDVSEMEIINKGFTLSSDLLKVGHHGSSSSTSQAFLNKVNPKYAVISAGKGNSYGHPHKGIMDRLKGKNIKVYRTDENGTIIATSDGTNITFNTKEGSYNSPSGSSGNSSTPKPIPSPKPEPKPEPKPTPAPTPPGNSSKTVYYTPSGGSYHFDKNCRTLSRSKTILSGSLSEAIAKGKDDPCDVCAN